ncbi:hypothetical protein VTK73DRAFT_8026 [Phialemonium thermophilum]|uniref:3-keto-alpha-glucoside-1,2-lyase/3-keto-2-hydroxy-glucal hydratase domain-containing protein n=1 Tax=Phialemonium thermophilum TaxID=223376 RepID=A0ABR3WB45_9PEZI
MLPQVIMTLPVAGFRPTSSLVAPETVPNYPTSEAGNPFVDGWYADPDTEIYEGRYWVFPTSSQPYDEQTYLDAFSSPDLVHWTKHPNVLTTANVSWATRAVWAPAPIARDGKYFLYFAANDIQSDGEVGGIGVAVSDRPEGPYVDAIGRPLIGTYHNGAQPIDQDVFIDDADGQAYIYYGGHSHANVAKLNRDMISIGTLDDGGTQFREITPPNYVEGAQMVKRNGMYYLMWSEGGWGGPDYAVSYAASTSPLGPFDRAVKILQQDPAVATGSGHNAVIRVPGSDIWYIVYHRRPLSETDQNHRVICYDRMYFEPDGSIRPVTMLVRDNFADGNIIGWKTYGRDAFAVIDGHLAALYHEDSGRRGNSMALLDTNFTDLILDADVSLIDTHGDAGLVFRVTNPRTMGSAAAASRDDEDNAVFEGYYAGIAARGAENGDDSSGDRRAVELRVFLRRSDGVSWYTLAEASMPSTTIVRDVRSHHLRVRVVGASLEIYLDGAPEPVVQASDATYASGQDGVRVGRASSAFFDNVSVAKPDGPS